MRPSEALIEAQSAFLEGRPGDLANLLTSQDFEKAIHLAQTLEALARLRDTIGKMKDRSSTTVTTVQV